MNKFGLKNILVTGCGGDIAISMARILRDSLDDVYLIGVDITNDNPAVVFFDKVMTVVRADDKGYRTCIKEVISKYAVNLIIPSTEAEISFFIEHGVDSVFNIPVLIPNKEIVNIGLNKLRTSEHLKNIGVLSPWTLPVGTVKPIEFPCIIKPVSGCGSKNISIVDEGSFHKYSDFGSKYIWQEYLYPDDEEYTCGVFRSRNGEVRIIIIKRELQGGLTGKGIVVENKSIYKLLETLAVKSSLVGSINAQLRLTAHGPVIFEINPRFSSTVMFRHKMGFHDLLWALEDKFNLHLTDYLAPKEGVRFYRVAYEVII